MYMYNVGVAYEVFIFMLLSSMDINLLSYGFFKEMHVYHNKTKLLLISLESCRVFKAKNRVLHKLFNSLFHTI